MPSVCGIDVLWKHHSVLVQKGGKNLGKGELRRGGKGMVFSSEGGSKVMPTSNFSTQLKPDDRKSTNTAKDLRKGAGSPRPNRLVCRTGKLKSSPII